MTGIQTKPTLAYLLLSVVLLGVSYCASVFEEQGYQEMTNINVEPLFSKNPYMIAYFTHKNECDAECRDTLLAISRAVELISNRHNFKKVYVVEEESKRVTKKLRVVDFPSIGYLANNRAVIY